MSPLHSAKTCELHVHPGGCLTAEDLLALGGDFYREVDWRLFTDAYERAYGIRPDPIALFRDALSDPSAGLDKLREHYIYAQKPGRWPAPWARVLPGAEIPSRAWPDGARRPSRRRHTFQTRARRL